MGSRRPLEARALLGDEEGAALALADGDLAATGTRYFDVWRFDARSALQRLAGRDSDALESARSGADWARSAGMPVEEALLLHAQVRIAPAPELAARLAELTHLTDSNLVSLLARHAEACYRSDPDALLGGERWTRELHGPVRRR